MGSTWFHWALLSAVFAALTAIFAKAGLQGVDSDYATLIRTAMILCVLGAFVAGTGKWNDPTTLPPRTWLFLGLSALATGASWVCYFRALQAGPAAAMASSALGLSSKSPSMRATPPKGSSSTSRARNP